MRDAVYKASTPAQQVEAYANPLTPKQKAAIAAGTVLVGLGIYLMVKKIKQGRAKDSEIRKFAEENGFAYSAKDPKYARIAVQMTPEQRSSEWKKKEQTRERLRLELLEGPPKLDAKGAAKTGDAIDELTLEMGILGEADRLETAYQAGVQAEPELPAIVPTKAPEPELTEEQQKYKAEREQAEKEWDEKEQRRRGWRKVGGIAAAVLGGLGLVAGTIYGVRRLKSN